MVKNASAGEKAGWSNGRTPLFSQKDLLRLVGPLLIEQFLAVTVGMADTMMVSRCGEAAISGVSLVDMINNLIIVLFAALATGGAVVVSQYLGAKEQEKANASAGQLILLSAILGTVVAAVCILFARPMISACYGSIDADVLDAGVLYLKITALSYPFLALYNAGAALFRSMGNSKISMQISVLMNIINIVGNAVCIFGLKMGVDGVAWPSVVSRVIAAVLILGRCYQKGHALTVPKTVKLDTGMAKRILGIGVPSAFENSLFEAGRIVVVSMISTFGTVQIAANAVANNLDGVGCIPGKAIGLAMNGRGPLHRRRGQRAGRLLYKEAAGLGLSRHGCAEWIDPDFCPASGGHLRAFGRDDGALHHSGLHPRGLCNAALASLLRAAQRPARRQRRQVHDDRLHRQHGLLACGLQLYHRCADGHGCHRRLDCHGGGLGLPRDLLRDPLPQRCLERKI